MIAILQYGVGTSHAATFSYASTSGSPSIADDGCSSSTYATRTLSVSQNAIVTDLNVGVVADHTYRGALVVQVISPSGLTVTVINQVGADSTDLNVRLDDSASSVISNSSQNSTNAYPQQTHRPTSPLSAFIGDQANGTWTVRICDNDEFNDTGTFTAAYLEFNGEFAATTGTQACSALTGSWTGDTALSGGITVTRTQSASGGSWAAAATGNMNTINAWSSTSVQNQASLVDTYNWTGPTAISGNSGTYTISFSKAVTNPVLHFDRIGGISTTGRATSSRWTLTSSGTLTRLAGSTHFQTLSNNSFLRRVNETTTGSESSLTPSAGTAAGSIMISGTHSSVSFLVEGLSGVNESGGDQFELVACAPQADLSLTETASNSSPAQGSNLTFTLTLTNSSSDAAPGVQVTDLLPTGLTFVSAAPSQGSYSSGTGLWTVGTVAANSSVTLQIVATASQTGTIVNTGQVTASTLVDPDSNPNDGAGDDYASASVTVVPRPTVTLTKISNGGTGAFTFTGNNGWSSQTITTTAQGGAGTTGTTQTLTSASTAITITETIPSGWQLTSVTCSGLGSGGTYTPNLSTGAVAFNAAATAGGSNIACTFTNALRPTVTLTKVSNGATGAFTFTGNNGWSSQTITTTAQGGAGTTGATQTLTAISTATTVTETIPTGWQLTSVTCSGLGSGGTYTPNLSTGAVTFNASATAPGATISCTFTNARLPTITLTKISNGGTRGFTFTGTNGWSSQTITTITAGVGVTGATQTLTAASTATTITETLPGNWHLTSVTCTGLGSGGTYTPNLSTGAVAFDAAATAPGATIACTFTNTRQADLSLAKTVSDAGPAQGTNVIYTVTVSNVGPGDASGIQVSDLLPSGTNFVSATPSQGTYASGTGLWTVGSVSNGGTATLQIVANVSGSGIIVNVAEVIASNNPDTDSTPNDGTGDDWATAQLVVSLPPVGTNRCTGTNLVSNGGFELPVFSGGAPTLNFTAAVPNWTTTDTDFEIWDSGYNGVPSHTGDQYLEMNAYGPATVTNSSATVQPRGELQVYWVHRGRDGTDTGGLVITDSGGGTTTAPNFSTGNGAWASYSATHVVSATGTSASLAFTSISSVGSAGSGNFLDTVEICQTYITITKAEGTRTDIDGSGGDSAGDTIAYTFTIANPSGNEKAISTVQIVDSKIGTFNATPIAGDTNSNNILNVGETWTVSAAYTLTQADINAGSVTNVAYVEGNTGTNTIRSSNALVTAAIAHLPELDIDKNWAFVPVTGDVNGNGIVDAGDTIRYTFTVENTGNLPIGQVTVTDTFAYGPVLPVGNDTLTDNAPVGDSSDSSGPGIWSTLAPADIVTFRADYTVTQDDVDLRAP